MCFCAGAEQVYSPSLSSLVCFNLMVNYFLRNNIRKVWAPFERKEDEFLNIC